MNNHLAMNICEAIMPVKDGRSLLLQLVAKFIIMLK